MVQVWELSTEEDSVSFWSVKLLKNVSSPGKLLLDIMAPILRFSIGASLYFIKLCECAQSHHSMKD